MTVTGRPTLPYGATATACFTSAAPQLASGPTLSGGQPAIHLLVSGIFRADNKRRLNTKKLGQYILLELFLLAVKSDQTYFSTTLAIASLVTAPTIRSCSWPPLKTISVGIPRMPYC